MKYRRVMCVFLLLAASCTTATKVGLVKSGKTVSCIVLPDNAGPVERHAAEELAAYVMKITGAQIPITNQVTGSNAYAVRIGTVGAGNVLPGRALDAARTRIKGDGFVISADPGGVQIISQKQRGLLYGVYELIRRCGGVVWLYPGEEGEYCPKAPDFVLPAQLTVCNPDFAIRRIALNGCARRQLYDTWDWMIRNGFQIQTPLLEEGNPDKQWLAMRAPVLYASADFFVLFGAKNGQEKMMAEHPGYFGLRDGKRAPLGYDRTCSQPCTSNPEVINYVADRILERIARYGDADITFHLANDDHMKWCQCENCLKLDPPEEKAKNVVSTRWWMFVNAVAAKVLSPDRPNVSFETFAYQNFRDVPLGVKPDPRVRVVICPHQRCYAHALEDPACPPNATRFRKMFEDWTQAGMNCSTFEYHTQLPGVSRYLPVEEPWVKDLVFYHRIGMKGFMVVTRPPDAKYSEKSEGYYLGRNMWYSLWQLHWLTGHFAWHINDRYASAAEGSASAYYGQAWPVMREYKAELVKAFREPPVHMGYGTPDAVLGQCYDRPGLDVKLPRLFAGAERAAAGDPVIVKRLKREGDYVRMNWVAEHKKYLEKKGKEIRVLKTNRPIAIDGNLEETVWRETPFVSEFMLADGKRMASAQTFVRMRYEADAIYLAIEAMEPMPKAMKETGNIWSGNHVEVFLQHLAMEDRYYQLAIDRNGKSCQAMATSGSSCDRSFDAKPEFKTKMLPDRWVAEIRVPTFFLKRRIQDGDVWRINIARVRSMADEKNNENSSWSGGIFHGSVLHRTVAFGDAGAIVKNGDFEEAGVQPRKTGAGKKWEYAGGQAPLGWAFNPNNVGRAELREDGAATGKRFIRIQGTDAFVEQALNLPDGSHDLKVRLRVKGKGKLLVRLRLADGSYAPVLSENADSAEWKLLAASVPCMKNGRMVLAFRISGEIDLDDVTLYREEPENMPEAQKHPAR